MMRRCFLTPLAMALSFVCCTPAADQPQLGAAWSRNFVSSETNLPAYFDPNTGSNILWSADLGTESYATPVIAGGKIYIGLNNARPRDLRRVGDRGVLYCLEERSGKLLWQLAVPKLTGDIYLDWPRSGLCSAPTVEGNRVYVTSNRGEVLCLDAAGMAQGNDGPFLDEASYMMPDDDQGPAVPVGALDADIIWRFDMVAQAGIWTHDNAHTSILIRGDYLYLNTGTGVDNTHKVIRTPEAPSIIVLHKATGKLVARDREGIAPDIFHATWSCPALGNVSGEETIVQAAGNGIIYGFAPLPPDAPQATLRKLWSVDFDPAAPKSNIHDYLSNRRESPSVIHGMPILEGGRLFVAGGGDLWWGKTNAWLKCYDTAKAPPTLAWSYELEKHVMATPSAASNMVFIGDCGGKFHCVDATTGKLLWDHDFKGQMWGSALLADGKVYAGTRNGTLLVFALAREKRLLSSTNLQAPISATPVAANGTLFVSTAKKLFAIGFAPGMRRYTAVTGA